MSEVTCDKVVDESEANIITKTFEELNPGDTIIIDGDPKCTWLEFRNDQEFTVEKKYEDKTVKVKELGGVVVKLDEYKTRNLEIQDPASNNQNPEP